MSVADDETERERQEQALFQEKYQVLLDWLKTEAKGIVRDGAYFLFVFKVVSSPHTLYTVVISNRLVTSPCAIVADQMGYTANIQKLMSRCYYL
jgi:heat shock protein 90kDa beta